MAELVIRARQGGKTTEMIRRCAEEGGCIVCINQQEAYRVHQLAQEMGLSIPFPLTPQAWRSGSYYPSGVRQLFFDNLDMIVQGLSKVPVAAATWTETEG